MRIAGWIFIVFGALSFFGAALKGHSVFGPLFWIGLGAFFLYRASIKNIKKPIASDEMAKGDHQDDNSINLVRDDNVRVEAAQSQRLESLDEIQSLLTLQQREAAMCLIAFFGGYNDNLMDDAPILLFKQAALFFGLPDSISVLSKIMSKYGDADMLVDIVLTIKPVKAKEFLLLTCYDLIKSSNKSEAYDLLFGIANDMGYDRQRFTNLISRYQ